MNNLNRLLLTALLVCGAAPQAAEPELKPGIVTASSVYEIEKTTMTILGVPATSITVDVSRVTIALDEVAITAEWEPKNTQSVNGSDFKPGMEVMAAVVRDRLQLRAPDGSLIRAKVVHRSKLPQK
jgi:hypothetical protein